MSCRTNAKLMIMSAGLQIFAWPVFAAPPPPTCFTSIRDVQVAIQKDPSLTSLRSFAYTREFIGSTEAMGAKRTTHAKISDSGGSILLQINVDMPIGSVNKSLPVSLCTQGGSYWAEPAADPGKKFPFTVSGQIVSLNYQGKAVQLWPDPAARPPAGSATTGVAR